MEPPASFRLNPLGARLAQPNSWLGGTGADSFAEALSSARTRLKEAAHSQTLSTGPIVVAHNQPSAFLAATLAAAELGLPVALASPRWGEIERTQAAEQIQPSLWLGSEKSAWPAIAPKIKFNASDWPGAIFIPTGGTSGKIRWAIHHWTSLASAARALDTFLGGGPFVHVSTLPPWHVAGLMPAVRALETGGKLWLENWKNLETGTPPTTPPAHTVISLVPTQLQRLLEYPAVLDWLKNARAILLGGAAPAPAFLSRARELRLPVALAYGLTESAAVVAAQTPADFLAGEPPHATPLSHAQIWIGDDQATPVPVGATGRIWIEGDSLFTGYFPERRPPGPFATDDAGTLDRQGRLQLQGRLDAVINTGGEKVYPATVEAALLACGLAREVLVLGRPDVQWGQRVTAIYTGTSHSADEMHAALAGRLSPHAIPKTWIHVERLPFDERGKLDRAALEQIVAK